MPEDQIKLDPHDEQLDAVVRRIEDRLKAREAELDAREAKLRPAIDLIDARSKQAIDNSLEGISGRYRAELANYGAFGLPGFANPSPAAPGQAPPPATEQHRPGSLEDVSARWKADQQSYGAFGLPGFGTK